MCRLHPALASLLIVLLVWSPTATVLAQEETPPSEDDGAARKRAIEVFTQGKTALKANDYDAALQFFSKAQAIFEHEPLIILALAKTHDQAGNLEKALNYFKLFLKTAPPDEVERPFAVKRIGELERLLASRPGTLKLNNLPSQTRVEINGEKREPNHENKLFLPPGSYDVLVTMDKRIPYERKGIRLGPGESKTLEVVLVAPIDESRLPRDHTWTWVAGGATAAALMATGVLGVMTSSSKSTYLKHFDEQGHPVKATLDSYGCQVGEPCPEAIAEGSEYRQEFIDRQNWTLIAGLTASGLALATVALFFAAPVKDPTRALMRPSDALQIAPQLSADGAGLVVGLRF